MSHHEIPFDTMNFIGFAFRRALQPFISATDPAIGVMKFSRLPQNELSSKERDVALAPEGGFVTASSYSGLGRYAPNHGDVDQPVSGDRIDDSPRVDRAKGALDWQVVHDRH